LGRYVDNHSSEVLPQFGHVGYSNARQQRFDTGGTIQHQQRFGATNYLGQSYRDMRLDDEINMTSTQTVIFVLLNFCLAVILIIAVNCNMLAPCGNEMKYWLIVFSLILALGSLVAVVGMDIER